MSIYTRQDEFGNIEVHVAKESAAKFRELVQRATNLWPDAPAEIKWFADIVTSGKPMQDYFNSPHLSGKIKATQADAEYAKKPVSVSTYVCLLCGAGSITPKLNHTAGCPNEKK